jgi:hypothetical protein
MLLRDSSESWPVSYCENGDSDRPSLQPLLLSGMLNLCEILTLLVCVVYFEEYRKKVICIIRLPNEQAQPQDLSWKLCRRSV